MFNTFKVVCKDAKHFEKMVCPMITKLKGLSYSLPPIKNQDKPMWDKDVYELGHYLVMLPHEIIEEELEKLKFVDNISTWTILHQWKD